LQADLVELDENGRIRMDDWEMQPEIQEEVERRWNLVPEQGLEALGDLAGYRHDFLELFGFGVSGIDYAADVDPVVPW
jgi:enoyl-[acyl-carrier protein] reductase/trans-2-enoyl-CoA reductase (NAD+)